MPKKREPVDAALPTVGRIVHFTPSPGKCMAAIVTALPRVKEGTTVNLFVFPDGRGAIGQVRTFVPMGANELRGTWHWPERVG